MEKEIWKWILDSFSDEGIANIGRAFGIKVPGFRQFNPQQKKFKIVRQKIIKDALNQKNAQNLIDFFNSAEEQTEIDSVRDKSIDELLKIVEDELPPSLILGVLLSSEEDENKVKAEEVYKILKDQKKLDLLEEQADESASSTEVEDIEENESLKQLHEELKLAQQTIDKYEKRLKKLEQKNEELKSKEAVTQAELKNVRKRGKEEKSALTNDINSIKGEIGSLKHQVKSITQEKEILQKRLESQSGSLKLKDDEISRLNALVLKLKTDLDKLSTLKESIAEEQASLTSRNQRIKVALIGNPKNTKIEKYNKFELNIIEGAELQEEETSSVLGQSEQVWLLTYKIPRSIQKRVRSLSKGKQIKEFATFIDLENYMLKGMI